MINSRALRNAVIFTVAAIIGAFYEPSHASAQLNLTLLGSYDTSGTAFDVSVAGNYAYVADSRDGLLIIDISDPTSPSLVGNYEAGTKGVYISGEYAYVTQPLLRLYIIDISEPISPTLKGSYRLGDIVNDVFVSNNYAYVACSDSGLFIVDVSNPSSPSLIGFYDTSGSAYDVYVEGSYAYVADYNTGLHIIDVSDPASPFRVGLFDTTGAEQSVRVVSDYAYLAAYGYGFVVLNVSDPSAPYQVGINEQVLNAHGLEVLNEYVFVADDSKGIKVVDVSDPTSPTIIGEHENSGNAYRVDASFSHAFLADGGAGLLIFAFDDGDGDGLPDPWEDAHECMMASTVDDGYDYDEDALDNYGEYVSGTDPCDWDTDGDALPDGFEVENSVGHGDAGLDPLCSDDGLGEDFDGDGIENSHEYYNGTDIWSVDVTGGASCYSWGDSGDPVAADGVVSPLDAAALMNRIVGNDVSYSGALPPNGDGQRLMGDPLGVSPLDLSLLMSMISGNDSAANPTTPTDLVVEGNILSSVEEGSTERVTVSVVNSSAIGYTSSIGVVFEIDPASTGAATLLGGEGPSGTGRYDVSGAMDSGGLSSIVVRVDAPGMIYLNATLPPCGDQSGKGRYCPEIEKAPAVTIVGY